MKPLTSLRKAARLVCHVARPKHPVLAGITLGMVVVHYYIPDYDAHVACIIGIICLEAA